MKSRLVGFLKQAKNRVSDWCFRRRTPTRANLLNAVAFSKIVRLIRAENKRMQLCLQIEFTEEKSPSLHSQKWPQQIYIRKEKNRYSWRYKKVLYAGPKHFYKLKPEPGSTYNSATAS